MMNITSTDFIIIFPQWQKGLLRKDVVRIPSNRNCLYKKRMTLIIAEISEREKLAYP